jgi:hypothetical protein
MRSALVSFAMFILIQTKFRVSSYNKNSRLSKLGGGKIV